MRRFLVAYFYGNGQGRCFIDTPAEGLMPAQDIEQWEKLIAEKSNLPRVVVTNFQEVKYTSDLSEGVLRA